QRNSIMRPDFLSIDFNTSEHLPNFTQASWQQHTSRLLDEINEILGDFTGRVQKLTGIDKFQELSQIQQTCITNLQGSAINYTQELINSQLSLFRDYLGTLNDDPDPETKSHANSKESHLDGLEEIQMISN
ncbi:hypothetical protein OAO18_08960, partial [Francisellaceae bacterium]|nr:hypothetical protein [Francisellaceae bacterium]